MAFLVCTTPATMRVASIVASMAILAGLAAIGYISGSRVVGIPMTVPFVIMDCGVATKLIFGSIDDGFAFHLMFAVIAFPTFNDGVFVFPLMFVIITFLLFDVSMIMKVFLLSLLCYLQQN